VSTDDLGSIMYSATGLTDVSYFLPKSLNKINIRASINTCRLAEEIFWIRKLTRR
jgi:hypothetical protein